MRKRFSAVAASVIVCGLVASALMALPGCSKSTSQDEDGIGLKNINPATPAASGDFRSPFDATPDPSGENVYFTALTADGTPGIFKVSAKGGPVTVLHQGAPLAAPFGIAISEDGQTLFVADGSAELGDGEDVPEDGAIFTLSVAGGSPKALGGTEHTSPRGVEVHGDAVFFTGKKDGQAGVFKTGLGGGAGETLVAGEPLREPSGIAVTKSGEVYIVDAFANDTVRAGVFKITPGKAELFKDGFDVGHPAGLAVIDDKALLVSGLDASKGTDVVYRVELADKSQKTFTDVIGEFTESAGLHKAKNADVYAWADSRANQSGTVYVLTK
jgi:DNA-binding beta-propeller fold protein YncE